MVFWRAASSSEGSKGWSGLEGLLLEGLLLWEVWLWGGREEEEGRRREEDFRGRLGSSVGLRERPTVDVRKMLLVL